MKLFDSLVNKYGTFDDAGLGEVLLNAPCGCPDCDHEVQSGHSYCSPTTGSLRKAEEFGLIERAFIEGTWRWVIPQR